jgi:hypothetical protein
MKKHLSEFQGLSHSPIHNHARSAKAKHKSYRAVTMFEPRAIWHWVTSYLRFAFCPRHPFLGASAAPNGTSIYTVPNQLRIAIAGDWGTGTEEADLVATQMLEWPDGGRADLTLHLGDVYYVGDDQEIRENCLGESSGANEGVQWPAGKLGSFGLNGNHEMYANGTAYFQTFLPTLGMKDASGKAAGQGPSFFCLENESWRIIGIDTAYNSVGLPILSLWFDGSCQLPDPLVQWLRDTVQPRSRPKATILLSHHQYFSAFGEGYPAPARQLAEFFDSPILWLWGHEHRLAGYQYFGTGELKVHGRCIGHGGMPVEALRPSASNPLHEKLLYYDARVNPLYGDAKLGYNGFVQMRLDGPDATIDYCSLSVSESPGKKRYSPAPVHLLTETFQAEGTNITLKHYQRLNDDKDFVLF